MNDVTRIVAVGVVLAGLLTVIRERDKAIGLQLAMAFVLVVLLFLVGPLREVIDHFHDLARRLDSNSLYIGIALKSIGIAYLTAFGAQLSRDAGEGAIANVIEMAGKVFILLLAVPVIAALLDVVVSMLP